MMLVILTKIYYFIKSLCPAAASCCCCHFQTFRPTLVVSHIHLSIRISVSCSFLSSTPFTAQYSDRFHALYLGLVRHLLRWVNWGPWNRNRLIMLRYPAYSYIRIFFIKYLWNNRRWINICKMSYLQYLPTLLEIAHCKKDAHLEPYTITI